jgi:hypothetical protein
MALLSNTLDQTWARQGRVIAITGETGIGRAGAGGGVRRRAGVAA